MHKYFVPIELAIMHHLLQLFLEKTLIYLITSPSKPFLPFMAPTVASVLTYLSFKMSLWSMRNALRLVLVTHI